MRNSRNLLRVALLVPALVAFVSPLRASETDRRIEDSIKGSYNFKTYLAQDGITIKSSGGVVTLSGTVAEEHHRILAAQTACDFPGVEKVNNELKLKAASPDDKSDGWVTMKVKGALAFHRNVSALGTQVETSGGEVTLKGEASSAAQKELTTEYAKDVEGVKKVNNMMTVTGVAASRPVAEKVDDLSITAQIKTSLLMHNSTHLLATKVKTKDGIVTLKGEADNLAEKALVGKLAEDTPGVKRVENEIVTKQPS